jgi:hypothetical protein
MVSVRDQISSSPLSWLSNFDLTERGYPIKQYSDSKTPSPSYRSWYLRHTSYRSWYLHISLYDISHDHDHLQVSDTIGVTTSWSTPPPWRHWDRHLKMFKLFGKATDNLWHQWSCDMWMSQERFHVTWYQAINRVCLYLLRSRERESVCTGCIFIN